jgi:uncharacterized protein YukE
MPAWQPNWTDVRFDFGRAEAAVAALRSTADLLDRQTDARVRFAADAQREWRGPSRDAFDVQLARMVREAADLAAALRSSARAIEAAAHEARLEQARRVDARQRWRDEQRREQALEAADR